MRFTVDEMGAAKMFIMNALAQSQPLDNGDAIRLGNLIRMFSCEAWHKALEEAKKAYQEIHPGGCKILSKGDNCSCFLCKMDELHGKVEK